MRVHAASFLLSLIWMFAVTSGLADEEKNGVVPVAEREIARNLGASGPSETTGVKSSTVLGAISLADEFANLEGRILRAREVVLSPGGVVGVHQHHERPGVAYVLEGEVVEHRNGESQPVTRGVGAVAFEKTGVIHWWVNESAQDARVLVVDIILDEDR